ncbi:probable U3 small nucleolar RNA-associated protein 11 [Agrilus planipennis]|uniref:U3 small nucleolar RNA-associated protein 11 n=1 Tax=Agrilus planipennis TaxID=224129 RepID=A0A1W4XT72_AGRPL|nr:probable U3 small nucleolar RNA-associated protein 11 [Agrilus planipennis]
MSVWKKASKVNQKVHRERHQPEERKHLGPLEKHKDYVERAKDYNTKKETLKKLHKRALNKNPDEFYHHMINSKIVNGVHHENPPEDEDSPEQLKLMRTQDIKYVITKRTEEQKKIEKLQALLHLSNVDCKPKNKHLIFVKNLEDDDSYKTNCEYLKKIEIPTIDSETFNKVTKKQIALYRELSKRIEREKQLAIVQQKIEMKRHMEHKTAIPPKKVKKGSKDSAPVYLWKYERKR